MRPYPQNYENTTETLSFLGDLLDEVQQISKGMAEFSPTGSYKPKKRMDLWQLLGDAFFGWKDELIAAEGESKESSYIGAWSICQILSDRPCDANTNAQIIIANALGLKLKRGLFGYSWKGSDKELGPDDMFRLQDGIKAAIVEVFLYFKPKIMQQKIKSIDSDLSPNPGIIALMIQTLSADEALQEFLISLQTYRYAAIDIDSCEPPRYTVYDYPDSKNATTEYRKLYDFCQTGTGKQAMEILGIDEIELINIDRPDTNIDEKVLELIEKIEEAFYGYICAMERHDCLIKTFDVASLEE